MKYILALLLLLYQISWASNLNEIQKEKLQKYFSKKAFEILDEVNLDTSMKLTLESEFKKTQVIISEEILIDNGGSIVDAIGVKNKIILNYDSWINFIKKGIDTRALILHELYRSAGINDDNYINSLPLYSFLKASEDYLRPYCNLRINRTKMQIKEKKMSAYGYGNIGNGKVLIFNNSSAGQAIADGKKNVAEKCKKRGYKDGVRFPYASYMSEMISSNSNGFTKRYHRVNVKGYCQKNITKKLSKKSIRKQICQKVNTCKEIINAIPKGQVLDEQLINDLDLMSKEGRCS